MFALFAGIYHWFPAVTGRVLSERLGKWHFWLSFYLMNNVFLPMFVIGLAGVNRRLYDAGLQYAMAQPFQALQRHMTWSAIALGVAQLPLLIAIVRALRGPAPDAAALAKDDAAAPGTPQAAPGTRRPALGTLPAYLLVAWAAMFFGSLLSGYVLLRTGNAAWPTHASGWGLAMGGAALLIAAAAAAGPSRVRLLASAVAALALVGWIATLHGATFAAGRTPPSHLEFASWFTLTGALMVVIAGTGVGAAWSAVAGPPTLARAQSLRVIWGSLSLIWLVILSVFSVA